MKDLQIRKIFSPQKQREKSVDDDEIKLNDDGMMISIFFVSNKKNPIFNE